MIRYRKKPISNQKCVYKKGLHKFCIVVSEVSSFVGNPDNPFTYNGSDDYHVNFANIKNDDDADDHNTLNDNT